MASMYEDMADEMASEEDMDTDADVAVEEESAGIDPEFEMHAKVLGFDTPEKMESFKMAIERCVDLRDQGGYEPAEGEEEDEEI